MLLRKGETVHIAVAGGPNAGDRLALAVRKSDPRYRNAAPLTELLRSSDPSPYGGSQGVLASAPAIEIVLPAPPWQRWYARLAMVILLLGAATIFGAWLSKRRIQRRLRLEGARHTEQLALARTETLGYISHEMRNLLNGVTGKCAFSIEVAIGVNFTTNLQIFTTINIA